LEKAEARQHILEGYLIALKNLDEIIHLIRNAADVESARAKLMKRYKLTELQANAILDMQLRRLAALERKKIETEYREVSALIKDLKALLKSAKLMRGAVAEELLRVKAAYADRRRTQIVNLKKGKAAKMLTATDLLPDQMVWVGVTADGLIARTHDDKQPKHSGHDAPRWLVKASTSDTLYLAAENGKCAAVALHVIPEAEKLSDGAPYYKVSPLDEDDALAAMFALPARKSEFPEETCVVTMTRFGMIKKSLISELPGPSAQAFTLARVNEGDRLGWVGLTDGKKKEILLITSGGMGIRFSEEDVRPMGLVAAGVNGIKLDEKDEVVGAEILPAEGEIFILASDGKAKRVSEKDFPSQGRYGKGVRVWDLPGKTTLVGAVSGKPNHMATIVLAKGAPKSTRLGAAGVRKRAATRGDVIVEMKKDEAILGVSVAWMVERYVTLSPKGKVAKVEEGERKQKAEGGKRKAALPKKAVATSSPKGRKKAAAKSAKK
jgi:DNA gyrase subunit A